MGYSHQWFYNDDLPAWRRGFDALCVDASALAEAYPGPARFEVTSDRVLVSPTRGQAQPLLLNRRTASPFVPPPALGPDSAALVVAGAAFTSVKTEAEAYDEAVTAVLLRAAVRLGDAIEVHSDGRWDDWRPGVELVAATFDVAADQIARPSSVRP